MEVLTDILLLNKIVEGNSVSGKKKIKKIQRVQIRFFKIKILFCFLGPPLGHIEVLRLGIQSKLQLPAYTTATATWDPSCICNLYHSSEQCQILNPLSEARDQTCILMDASQIRFSCAKMGTRIQCFLIDYFKVLSIISVYQCYPDYPMKNTFLENVKMFETYDLTI